MTKVLHTYSGVCLIIKQTKSNKVIQAKQANQAARAKQGALIPQCSSLRRLNCPNITMFKTRRLNYLNITMFKSQIVAPALNHQECVQNGRQFLRIAFSQLWDRSQAQTTFKI